MSERRDDDATPRPPGKPGQDRGWMAEFEEDLRRMHLERRKPRAPTSLLAKLRQWWRRSP